MAHEKSHRFTLAALVPIESEYFVRSEDTDGKVSSLRPIRVDATVATVATRPARGQSRLAQFDQFNGVAKSIRAKATVCYHGC